jgi:hypothetical protein
MRYLLRLAALILFVSAALIGWTSDDRLLDVLRDCFTLTAAGFALTTAASLIGERP